MKITSKQIYKRGHRCALSWAGALFKLTFTDKYVCKIIFKLLPLSDFSHSFNDFLMILLIECVMVH